MESGLFFVSLFFKIEATWSLELFQLCQKCLWQLNNDMNKKLVNCKMLSKNKSNVFFFLQIKHSR